MSRRRTQPTGRTGLTRRTVLAGTGAGALGLTGCTLLGIEPGPRRSPEALAYEFYPSEEYTRIEIRPDGTLAVSIEMIVDAGDGVDEPLSAWFPHEVNLGRLPVGSGRFVIRPSAVDLRATGIAPTPGPLPIGEGVREESGTRWRIGGPWAPGRHRIRLEHGVTGAWTAVGGDPRLVLCSIGLGAPWYGAQGGYDATRVTGDPAAWLVDRQGTETALEDVTALTLDRGRGELYFFVRPDGITAAPTPAEVVR